MPISAVSFSDWNIHDPAPEQGRRSAFVMRGCELVTPPQRGRTHDYWGAAFDVSSLGDDVIEKKTRSSVIAAFDENKHLVEKLQAQLYSVSRRLDYPAVTPGADGVGIKVQQVLKEKLAATGRSLS